jgi:hypothetical protein
MRWCCWRCWWRLVLPWWEDRWWCRWRLFPPPGGKYPRQNLSAGEQKCSCPSSASRQRRTIPKVFSIIFLGQMHLYTRRWGPELGQGPHEVPGHAWEGGAPCCLVGTGWPPSIDSCANIFYIFQNNSPKNFSSIGVVQNRYLDRAFPGPEFQLPVFSLLVWILHIKREKALELLHKVLYWLKTL